MESTGGGSTSTGAPAGSLKEVALVAAPMILSFAVQSLMHVVDRVFLYWYDARAMAAAMPAGILFWSALSLAHGTAQYTNTFVAQYEGANQPHRVAAAMWQGVYFSLIAGGLLTLLFPFADDIFRFVGHSPDIAAFEASYFKCLCLGGVPTVVMTALTCFFSGRGETHIVFWVNVSAVLVNAVLDWALIFGRGPFLEWGVAGAAIATSIANLWAMSLFLALFLRPKNRLKYNLLGNARFDAELTGRMLRYGLPNGLLMFIDVAGFTVFLFVIGWIGDKELAATTIAFNLNSLAFTPVVGCGIAVSTLVGQRIGERRVDLAQRTAHRGFLLAGTYMLLAGAVYVGLPELLMKPYSAYEGGEQMAELRPTVVLLLRFVALYSFFDAMAIVYGSAIRGAGDTRFSMIFMTACAWCLLVLPTWLTWRYYEKSLLLCWIYCSIYVITLGIGFWLRFQTGRWRTMSVIEQNAVQSA